MKITLAVILLSFVYVSCRQGSSRELILEDGTRAVGNINGDSVYNGVINFFDNKSERLLYSASYKNGVLDGEKIDYLPSGKIYSKQFFSEGKLNGNAFFYDENGNISNIQHYFHGLSVGPKIQFKSQRLIQYDFYSFENVLIFSINYDSLANKKLTDIEDDFFFFNSSDYKFLADSIIKEGKDYFMYLPHPPKMLFRYSLVQVDSNYNNLANEIPIDDNNVWTTFEIPEFTENKYSLKLFVLDSTNQADYTMFKRL